MMEHGLHSGTRFTGVTVIPDDICHKMWRIRQGDRLSDMVNLTRARDAALSWARADGWKIDAAHRPRWKSRTCRTVTVWPRIEQTQTPAMGLPAAAENAPAGEPSAS